MSGTANPLTPPWSLTPYAGNPLMQGAADASDAYTANVANARDTWQAMRDPQTWTDAANAYGNGLLGGTVGPEAKVAGLGLDAAALKVLRDMTPQHAAAPSEKMP